MLNKIFSKLRNKNTVSSQIVRALKAKDEAGVVFDFTPNCRSFGDVGNADIYAISSSYEFVGDELRVSVDIRHIWDKSRFCETPVWWWLDLKRMKAEIVEDIAPAFIGEEFVVGSAEWEAEFVSLCEHIAEGVRVSFSLIDSDPTATAFVYREEAYLEPEELAS